MLLADMGAEVTLLERAGGTFASQLFGGGRKAVANRGKKSLCIDLKHPEAKALVFKLIEDADVLIEGVTEGNTAGLMALGFMSFSGISL